jgi:hypothetical protein
MLYALLLIEPADPAGPPVVFTVPAEYGMNLIHEAQRKLLVFCITRLTIELKEVTDGKSIGPQIAPWNVPGW